MGADHRLATSCPPSCGASCLVDISAGGVVRAVLWSVLSVDIPAGGVVRAVFWGVVLGDALAWTSPARCREPAVGGTRDAHPRWCCRGAAGGCWPVNSGPCATAVGLP